MIKYKSEEFCDGNGIAMLNPGIYKLKSMEVLGCKNPLIDLLQLKIQQLLTFSSLGFLESFEGNIPIWLGIPLLLLSLAN